MKKNMKREANRRMAENRAKGHGSPRETAAYHGGEKDGAGELEAPGNGPGVAAKSYMGRPSDETPTAPPAPAKPNGKMSKYSEE